nr:hypothetical protein CFP56_56981 [Quercus suber]
MLFTTDTNPCPVSNATLRARIRRALRGHFDQDQNPCRVAMRRMDDRRLQGTVAGPARRRVRISHGTVVLYSTVDYSRLLSASQSIVSIAANPTRPPRETGLAPSLTRLRVISDRRSGTPTSRKETCDPDCRNVAGMASVSPHPISNLAVMRQLGGATGNASTAKGGALALLRSKGETVRNQVRYWPHTLEITDSPGSRAARNPASDDQMYEPQTSTQVRTCVWHFIPIFHSPHHEQDDGALNPQVRTGRTASPRRHAVRSELADKTFVLQPPPMVFVGESMALLAMATIHGRRRGLLPSLTTTDCHACAR